MDTPRPWRDVLIAVVAVGVVALAVVGVASLGGHIGKCVGTVESGPFAGYTICGVVRDNEGPYFAKLVLAAAITLAIGGLVRFRGKRPELIALIGWTLMFAALGTYPSHPSVEDWDCSPSEATCYMPWAPGINGMVMWAVISVAILVVGYVLRPRGSPHHGQVVH